MKNTQNIIKIQKKKIKRKLKVPKVKRTKENSGRKKLRHKRCLLPYL